MRDPGPGVGDQKGMNASLVGERLALQQVSLNGWQTVSRCREKRDQTAFSQCFVTGEWS